MCVCVCVCVAGPGKHTCCSAEGTAGEEEEGGVREGEESLGWPRKSPPILLSSSFSCSSCSFQLFPLFCWLLFHFTALLSCLLSSSLPVGLIHTPYYRPCRPCPGLSCLMAQVAQLPPWAGTAHLSSPVLHPERESHLCDRCPTSGSKHMSTKRGSENDFCWRRLAHRGARGISVELSDANFPSWVSLQNTRVQLQRH